MSLNSHSSAGVYVREQDLSQRIENASTSIGAIVGVSNKGPVMERTLITSVRQFLQVFGKPDARTSYMHYCALAFLAESKKLYVTRALQLDALTAGAFLTVDDVNATTPLLQLTNFDGPLSNVPVGKYDPFNTYVWDPAQAGIENVLMFFCAVDPGVWNNSIYVRVRPSNARGVAEPDDPYVFYVDVFLDYKSSRQQPDETFLVSRDYRTDGFGRQMNIEEVINNQSSIIRVRTNPYSAPQVKVLGNGASEFFDGAANGSALVVGTSACDAAVNNGWELYRDPEILDVNILINGGYASPAVQLKMTDIAESRMDCIAVLDMPPAEQELSRAVNYRRNTLNLDSSYAALYTPDVQILDVYNDRVLFVPPSGHVAGAYAYTDENAETWFAPAGMDRGDLAVTGLRENYGLDARDVLTDAQINAIRKIPDAGYKIWGADTLQVMASALSNVNVRRLLNFIEKSVSIAALYSVFNPNTQVLRNRLTEMTNRFLAPIKGNRGLYYYYTQCDDVNNPPELVASGDVILDVYLDPVIPAKRIHLNATVTKTGGAKFTESAT